MTLQSTHSGRIGSFRRAVAQTQRGAVTPFPGTARAGDQRRVLIVDAQAMSRRGLALLLARSPRMLVEEAADLKQARQRAMDGMTPGLVFVDSGLIAEKAALASLVELFHPAAVVVLGPSDDPALARDCIARGARGFVGRSDEAGVLEAVAAALLETGVDRAPFVQIPRWALPVGGTGDVTCQPKADAAGKLTRRQQDIVRLLLEGCSNKEIARRIGVLEGTVKVHVRAVMMRLGLHNRTQVALLAAQSGGRVVG